MIVQHFAPFTAVVFFDESVHETEPTLHAFDVDVEFFEVRCDALEQKQSCRNGYFCHSFTFSFFGLDGILLVKGMHIFGEFKEEAAWL